MVMVWILSLCAFNAPTAARAVSQAFNFFNLQMMVLAGNAFYQGQ